MTHTVCFWLAWLVLGATVTSSACSSREGATNAPARPTMARPAAVARITELHGDVRVQAAGTDHWVTAHVGTELGPSDAVQAMQGAHAVIGFTQGHGTLSLDPGTTLRVPRQSPNAIRAHATSGHLVVRVDGDANSPPLELEIPPGTLVLAAGENTPHVEAAVDIAQDESSVEMIAGDGRLVRRQGDAVVLREASRTRFDSRGVVRAVEMRAAPRVPLTLLAPEDGKTVRTRETVAFSWTPVADATAYRIRVSGDGAPVERQVEAAQATLPLSSGAYQWTVVALQDNETIGESSPRALRVDVDRQPPPLSLSSPTPGASATQGRVHVAGTTEAGCTVTVDDAAVPVGDDGHFQTDVLVDPGITNLVVVSVDPVGNRHVVARIVSRSR